MKPIRRTRLPVWQILVPIWRKDGTRTEPDGTQINLYSPEWRVQHVVEARDASGALETSRRLGCIGAAVEALPENLQ